MGILHASAVKMWLSIIPVIEQREFLALASVADKSEILHFENLIRTTAVRLVASAKNSIILGRANRSAASIAGQYIDSLIGFLNPGCRGHHQAQAEFF